MMFGARRYNLIGIHSAQAGTERQDAVGFLHPTLHPMVQVISQRLVHLQHSILYVAPGPVNLVQCILRISRLLSQPVVILIDPMLHISALVECSQGMVGRSGHGI